MVENGVRVGEYASQHCQRQAKNFWTRCKGFTSKSEKQVRIKCLERHLKERKKAFGLEYMDLQQSKGASDSDLQRCLQTASSEVAGLEQAIVQLKIAVNQVQEKTQSKIKRRNEKQHQSPLNRVTNGVSSSPTSPSSSSSSSSSHFVEHTSISTNPFDDDDNIYPPTTTTNFQQSASPPARSPSSNKCVVQHNSTNNPFLDSGGITAAANTATMTPSQSQQQQQQQEQANYSEPEFIFVSPHQVIHPSAPLEEELYNP